jgi:cobalt-precorrin 5A hydrolase
MIAIGIGANSRANSDDFPAAIGAIRREAGGGDVIATLEEAGFANLVKAAASHQSVTYLPLALEDLRNRSDDCLTQSKRTLGLLGVASVAEAAALVAAGPGSHLVVPRRIIGNITVAAARSADARESPE